MNALEAIKLPLGVVVPHDDSFLMKLYDRVFPGMWGRGWEMDDATVLMRYEKQMLWTVVDKAKALNPDFVAALNSFGERAMVEKVAQAMSPMALIGGNSVMDVLKKLLEGTNLAKHLALPADTALAPNGRA